MAGNAFLKWLAKDSEIDASGNNDTGFTQLKSITSEYLKSYGIEYNDKYHKHLVVMYPKHLAFRMIITSCLMTINLLTTIYYGIYDLMLCVIIVEICSLNHWRFPIIGLRRSSDIVAAQVAFFYHLYVAYYELNSFDSKLYLYVAGIGSVILYVTVIMFGINGMPQYSSAFHAGWHIFGIIINTYLYVSVFDARNSIDNVNS